MSQSILNRVKRNRNPVVSKGMLRELKLLIDFPICPVRYPLERIGETVNLLDPVEQLRFQVVMLARKYRKKHPLLARLCSQSGKRALTQRECRDALEVVESLGDQAHEQGQP
jgi:hypothetical protein